MLFFLPPSLPPSDSDMNCDPIHVEFNGNIESNDMRMEEEHENESCDIELVSEDKDEEMHTENYQDDEIIIPESEILDDDTDAGDSGNEDSRKDLLIPDPISLEIFPYAGMIDPGQLPQIPLPDDKHPIWHPFISPYDFQLAEWFIETDPSQEKVNQFFSRMHGASGKTSFKSAHELCLQMKRMQADMFTGTNTWLKGNIKSARKVINYWYRPLLPTVQYLFSQRAFKEKMVYTPIQVHEGDERLYSELHTGNWWAEAQVSTATFLI